MLLTDFLKDYVLPDRIKKTSALYWHDRKVNHAPLKNGWLVPVSLITAFRRHYPKDTIVEINDPFLGFETAITLSYRTSGGSGKTKIYLKVLKGADQ